MFDKKCGEGNWNFPSVGNLTLFTERKREKKTLDLSNIIEIIKIKHIDETKINWRKKINYRKYFV